MFCEVVTFLFGEEVGGHRENERKRSRNWVIGDDDNDDDDASEGSK
jgi:hypothetical protein